MATEMRSTMRSIYHLKRRHCFRYLSTFVWAQHIAPKKCCPIKCSTVYPKWILALMWRLKILKQPKQPKRNCWEIRKIRRYEFAWCKNCRKRTHLNSFYVLFCLFFSQPRHILYQAIWPWTSYSIIDVSVLTKINWDLNKTEMCVAGN